MNPFNVPEATDPEIHKSRSNFIRPGRVMFSSFPGGCRIVGIPYDRRNTLRLPGAVAGRIPRGAFIAPTH